jgi:AraC-like DNA-binding protein
MDTAVSGRIRFNTGSLPQRDRFPAVREEFARRLLRIEVNSPNPAAYAATFDLRCIGPLVVGYIEISAGDLVRTPELIRDGEEFIFFTYSLEGQIRVSQPDIGAPGTVGQAVVLDSTHIGGIHFDGNARYVTTKISRSQVAQRLPPGARFAGNAMRGNAAAPQLLIGYIEASRNIEFRDGERTAELFSDHVLDLLVLALGGEGEQAALAEERGLRAARRAAILRAIERRSGDLGLSAAAIAATLGVTPRYVHMLLEETGKTFTHHLLEQRLKKVVASLRDPARRKQRIGEIAAEAGFVDISHFNRAFRRRFGATPSDIRDSSS